MEDRASIIADIIRAYGKGGRALIFAQTKMEVDDIASSPELRDSARQIHGDVDQKMREKTLLDYRNGKFNILVATDVAARGIDVPAVEVVIQASVPESEDTFVHRSGRTGRAGRKGVNCVIYKPGDEVELSRIQQKVGMVFHLEGAPSPKYIMEARVEGVASEVASVSKRTTAVFRKAAAELEASLGDDALAGALAVLAGYAKGPPAIHSLLTGRTGQVTLQCVFDRKTRDRATDVSSFRMLMEEAFPGARMVFSKVVALKDGFLVDLSDNQVPLILGNDWEVGRDAAYDDLKARDERGEEIGAYGGAPLVMSKVVPGVQVCAPLRLPSLKDLVQAIGNVSRGGVGGGRGYGGFKGGGSRGYGGGGGRGGGGGYGGDRESGGGRYQDRNSGRGGAGGSRGGGGWGEFKSSDSFSGGGGGSKGGGGYRGGGGGGYRSDSRY